MKKFMMLFLTVLLSSCVSVSYQPIETISQIDRTQGYRIRSALANNDGNLIIVMFSGGGTRAAALGYGMLEQFSHTPINTQHASRMLIDQVDMVYGVSGGAVLAAYYALEGRDVIPKFEEKFLKKDFQGQVVNQIFSLSNLPLLMSPQFGRGDLSQKEFNLALYKGKTFRDLEKHRKGPFAIISATDMNAGQKITFTQDFFDAFCLNLGDLEIARAVAASSTAPLVLSPLTLNNNGGHCHFSESYVGEVLGSLKKEGLTEKNLEETRSLASYYQREERPFLHLVDGGLTDNVGLAGLLDIYDVAGQEKIYAKALEFGLKRIIVININAQNEESNEIDKRADVPGTMEMINTVINVPIDRNTQTSLRRFREFTDEWNKAMQRKPKEKQIAMHFVSLGLRDLPDSPLKKEVLNISTTFALPPAEINKLKQSARILLENSAEYRAALRALQSY